MLRILYLEKLVGGGGGGERCKNIDLKHYKLILIKAITLGRSCKRRNCHDYLKFLGNYFIGTF